MTCFLASTRRAESNDTKHDTLVTVKMYLTWYTYGLGHDLSVAQGRAWSHWTQLNV
jgi:predicted alpha/beta hydrolase